jgi:ribosome-binding protein aMBF1 (putative translation factor)
MEQTGIHRGWLANSAAGDGRGLAEASDPPVGPDGPARGWSPRMADPAEGELAREIGRRLARERTARGWSHERLARRLGVDRTAIGRWERGSRQVPLHRLLQLARLMEIRVEALLPDEGSW